MNTKCRVWHTIFPGSVPLEEVLYHTEIRGTCLVPWASGTTSRPALAAGTPPFCPHGGKLCTKVCLSFGRCSSPERNAVTLSALPRYVTVPCLLVQSGGVTHQELRQAAHLLQGCGLPLLGTVLNRTPY